MVIQYFTVGDVHEKIKQHFHTKGTGMDFRTAYLALLDSGGFHVGTPRQPNFLAWDQKRIEDLASLAMQVPVEPNEVLSIPPVFNKELNTNTLPPLTDVQITFEPPYAVSTLTSIEYFVIIWVLKGKCSIQLPNAKQTLNVGELIILPPNLAYVSSHDESDYVLNIISSRKHFETNFFQLFDNDSILSDFFKQTLHYASKEYLMFHSPIEANVLTIIAQLFNEYTSAQPHALEIFNNYLQIFFYHLLRNSSHAFKYFHAEGNRVPEISIPAILQYIRMNFRHLSLKTLAEEFHYDTAYLSKHIKKHTQKTYSQIVTELKITEAKHLLMSSYFGIEQISEAVGYNSSDHFSHTFHRVTGQSPSTFRKGNQLHN